MGLGFIKERGLSNSHPGPAALPLQPADKPGNAGSAALRRPSEVFGCTSVADLSVCAVYIYIYLSLSLSLYICIFIYIHVRIHIYIYTHTVVCTRVCLASYM